MENVLDSPKVEYVHFPSVNTPSQSEKSAAKGSIVIRLMQHQKEGFAHA